MKTKFIVIAISAVVFFNLWPFHQVVADTLRPIEIALGNWAPIIEEKRAGYGAVTEKITIVLRRMGYQPTYIFMPWDHVERKVASNETNSGPRVTFPYLKTDKRKALFMYSEKPVFQACMKFFYHKEKIRNPDMTRLTTLDDLKNYSIGYVAESGGFQYPDKLSKILTKHGKDFNGLYNAFEQLTNEQASDVQVVPSAQKVGEHLLDELFPEARKEIDQLQESASRHGNDCLLPVNYYLLVSRKNPNNAEFMDRFNKEYARLLADKESTRRIDRREEERGSLRQPLVLLDGSPSHSRILANTENGEQIHIPRGTLGILLDWSSPAKAKDDSPRAIATVSLISGPYRGLTVTLSGDHLHLD